MMERILPSPLNRPLHGRDRTRRIETDALNANQPHALMQRAGHAVSRLVRATCPHGRTAWVAAGQGNNGGDGLIAARLLHELGWQVRVSLLADEARLPADARQALMAARSAGVQMAVGLPGPHEPAPDVVIDALLGIGAKRAREGLLAEAIRCINRLKTTVIAIDLPSGLDAETGQALGDDCVTATRTLSLLTLKPGLFTGSGRDFSGEVWLDTLGVDPVTYIDAHIDTRIEAPDAWLIGRSPQGVNRLHAQHKGSFGNVAVIGGAAGMRGALLLAARASHAAGAGRVYVSAIDASGTADIDPLRPELMHRPEWWNGPIDVLKQSTVVCGCGAGDTVHRALPALLSHTPRLVLDADALNAVAIDESLQDRLTARTSHGLDTVLTPHPLEAARLLGSDAKHVQADRLGAARALAERFQCSIVLKGSGSVVTAPGTTPFINSTGNASLATAGTGDVLAGWLGGHWAAHGGTGLEAAVHTTWLHGYAAQQEHDQPLRAADLVEAMHRWAHR